MPADALLALPPEDGQPCAGTLDPPRQRGRWALACVALALVLATTIALLVLR